MINKKPLVSLIICTYNRNQPLVDSINCALKQDYENLEILVVDQTLKHTPDVSAFLKSVKDKIRYFFLSQPSVTRARNLAIKEANGEILVYIDDDTLFEKDFIQHHVNGQKVSDVVQGRIIEPGRKPKKNKPQWLTWYLKIIGSDNCTVKGKVNILTGAHFSLSKEAVRTVGYFDESFEKIAVWEDGDYGYRCFKAGLILNFWPEAQLIHLRCGEGGVDSGINKKNKGVDERFFSYDYYYNEMRFCYKHFNKYVQFYYKIRLFLRGLRALKKLIRISSKDSKKNIL